MPSIDDLKNNLQKKSGLGDLQDKLQKKTPPKRQDSLPGEKPNRVRVECNSIDEGLEKASTILGASRINLDYNVVQRGGGGFLGVGKKPFILDVFIEGAIDTTAVFASEDSGDNLPEIEVADIQKDGEVKVYIRKSGIFIKVSPPNKGGKPAGLDTARTELMRKGIQNYDMNEIAKIVQKAKGKEEKIGKWLPNPQYDSKAVLEITDDQMKAMVTVTAPILSGRMLEPEEIVSLLENNGVKYGVKHDKIKAILEKEIYNVPVIVAEGVPPRRGKDASVSYQFKTKHDEIEFEENEDGSIDFKKTDLVQNVVPGQLLATKILAEKGEPGRTITNLVIPAANGADVEMRAGKNTELSPDGKQIIATTSGQAVLFGETVVVEEIYEIKGDVDFNTGNIVFLGTVIIKGSVLDEFAVKATRDIIVKGTVGKSELESEGDIIISGGVMGKGAGKIIAGGSVYSKFIENVSISAGQDVVAKEGILHSRIDAGSRVICNGKRAAIVGGKIRAGQEINSKLIGSQAYTDTLCEAGVDPKTKERLEKLEKEHIDNEAMLNKLFININTLQKHKEAAGSLPEEKENMLKRMLRAKSEFTLRMKEVQDEVEELRNYLLTLENTGKVSAKVCILPGVEVVIKNASFKVKQEFKFTTFVYEAGYIKPLKYQEIDGMEDDRLGGRR